jgi:pimeloyl-ACP methyl ester carboxylesterase
MRVVIRRGLSVTGSAHSIASRRLGRATRAKTETRKDPVPRLGPDDGAPVETALSRRLSPGWLTGVETRAGQVVIHCVEHGAGRPVLILHGAGVDHREAEACFEPVLEEMSDLRRIYPDLPGMGRTIAPETLRSADDVLDTLLTFADAVSSGSPLLLIGHSAGAYYARAMAARRPAKVAGLALVCPLLPGLRDVPEHRVVVGGSGAIGDDVFRSYFVIQTPEMLERYERFVAPAAALVDEEALERIGERWALAPDSGPTYGGPTLLVAGRLDSTVGYAAATDLVDHYPHASLAVVDDAGHALPHERPALLRALLVEWLARVECQG